MQLNYIYCDICDCPIKDEVYYLDIFTTDGGVDPDRLAKEICSSCKSIVEDIFKLKKTKIKQITEKIEKTYELKSKQPKRKKKSRKKKC